MSALYDRLAATTARLFAQYGREMTFTRVPKTANGTTGAVTAGAATTTKGKVIRAPIDTAPSAEAFDSKLEDGSLAGREVAYLKVAALGMVFAPAALDTVSFDGTTWQVLGCTPINPAGTPIVYGVGVVKL